LFETFFRIYISQDICLHHLKWVLYNKIYSIKIFKNDIYIYIYNIYYLKVFLNVAIVNLQLVPYL